MAAGSPARANPTVDVQGNREAAAVVGSTLFSGQGTIDLTVLGKLSVALPVQGLDRFSARVETSAFGTAVVEVKKSIDGVNPAPFLQPKLLDSSTPEIYDRKSDGAAFIIFEVTTPDVTADTKARVFLYPYRVATQSPFDYAQEVNAGRVPGSKFEFILGVSALTASGSVETVWTKGGLFVPPTAAETLNIVSTSVNDTAAGTGARILFLRGVDSTFAEITETVTLNGTTPVVTVNQFLILNSMKVLTAGSTRNNEGIVSATQSTSALLLGRIEIVKGAMLNSIFMVPLGTKAYVWHLEREMTSRNAAKSTITVYVDLPDPLGVKNIIAVSALASDGTSAFATDISARTAFPAGALLTAEHEPDTNNTTVAVVIQLLLEDQ